MAQYTAIEQHQRLLDEKDEFDLQTLAENQKRRLAGLCGCLISPPAWIFYVFAVYAVLSIPSLVWISWNLQKIKYKPYSPANAIVDYEIQKIYADTSTVFSEEPSEKHNQAWENLLAPMHMYATKYELEKSDDKPAQRLVLVKTVPGGVGQGRWTDGDYLATLGVYHELHRLRRLYWHFYPDIYFTNLTSEIMEQERGHARHCIDTIRQSLMCNPNLGLYSFKWKGDNEKPELKTGASRKCVSWGLVQDWSNKRATGWNPLIWRPKNTTAV